MSEEQLWELGVASMKALETEEGILASAREEIYGCIFGRDSIITSLSLLDLYVVRKDPYYLSLVRKVLTTLVALQGKEVNIESGEEPGKCIHEYRPLNHERLSAGAEPWYVYPDNVLRNYDSVDSTPLFLMLFHRYGEVSGDWRFVEAHMPAIQAALTWLLECGDTNGDSFIDYRFHPDRKSGGLRTQSWMDSSDSVFYENSSTLPPYPIAPVEVQAYAYAALRGWSRYFVFTDSVLSQTLAARATALKEAFNRQFVLRRGGVVSLAFALNGEGKPLTSARSSMGHCLWAAGTSEEAPDSVLDQVYVEPVVRRLLAPDLFVRRAGVRTLSSRSSHYDPLSYHNGSIWPHDTAILAAGLEKFGYISEARMVRRAALRAYKHFKTPVELFGYTGRGYRPYAAACQTQAWSVASLLTTLNALAHA